MRLQSSHSDSARGLDAYFTPREAVVSLMKIEAEYLPMNLWEPACGDGAIVKPLRERGYKVRASDIADYGFECELGNYFSLAVSLICAGIVTNPPFKLALNFAEKALSEVPYLALLLRTNFLESQDRLGFFRQHPPTKVWISSRRLPMMHRHGWDGPEAPSNTCHAWFVWHDRVGRNERELDWFDWQEHQRGSLREEDLL